MNEEPQPTTTTSIRTCYRHHDRETRVSCGRCGRPLCPDCMQHGPVGVRCAECLRPPRVEVNLAAPERVGVALGVAAVQAVVWVILLSVLSLKMQTLAPLWLKVESLAPNLLISGIAGGMVGWTIWRMCGRTFNRQTTWWALALGTAIPLVASLVIHAMTFSLGAHLSWLVMLRVLAAAVIGGCFAWLLATQRHVERDLFER